MHHRIYDELTGEVGAYTVTATISHVDEDIVHLTIDGELLETTAEHPFYTDDGTWVDAADLEVGERILSLDGDYGAVEAVEVAEDVYQPMYNLTVDEAHTFAVGDGAWVVHQGAYDDFEQPYAALGRWIEANGYVIAGPPREIHLTAPEADKEPITEIQYPVAKA